MARLIDPDKKYYFNMGYDRLIILAAPSIVSGIDARETIRADVARARRYFGTAHAEYTKGENGTVYIEVRARRDKNSALWGRWILKAYYKF